MSVGAHFSSVTRFSFLRKVLASAATLTICDLDFSVTGIWSEILVGNPALFQNCFQRRGTSSTWKQKGVSIVVLAGRRYTCPWSKADLLLHGNCHGLRGLGHNSATDGTWEHR